MERYALFDWDGTLREGYTLFEWIGFLRERGEILSARVLKRHDRLVADYRDGRISHDVLARESCQNYEEGIRGTRVERYEALRSEYHRYDRTRQLAFAPVLFRWLKDRGIQPVVITGAPVDMIEAYFGEYGIGEAYGHRLEMRDGRLTGNALENCGFHKERKVRELAERFGCPPMLAAGDSDSDLPLLLAAKTALVVRGRAETLARVPGGKSVPREIEGVTLIQNLENWIGECEAI